MTLRIRLAAVVLASLSFASACAGSDAPEQQVDGFTTITDCRELENLASIEVDRINTSGDADVVRAATDRFQRIVAHRDSIC